MIGTASSYESLSKQADKAAEYYLDSATDMLTQRFGEGYAKEHPALVGQLVYAMATDFHGMALSKTMTEFTERLSYILDRT